MRITTRRVPGAPRPLTAPADPRRFAGLALGVVIGLLALGPGLRRGFLLNYDMVIVPREPFTAAMFGLAGGPPRAVPSDAVMAIFSRIVPADIAQKLVLVSIFALACAGAAALLEREPWFARLAAGVFYAWNPFVAERLLIGQWALLLGYAGLPWALRAAIAGPLASWRGAGRLGLALLPAAVGGFAAMAISALVVVPAAVLAPGGPARRRLTSVAAALAVLAVASLPWLIPSVLRTVYADPAGIAAFAARADTPFGSLGSLVMLGGAWNAQTVPAGYGGAWSALWLALVLAAAAGYVAFGLRRHRWPGLTFAAVAGLAIASIGVTAAGRGLLRAAIGSWPGFAVLWDGQQFVAPLALAEAVGAGLLVTWAARAHATAEHHQPRTGRPGLAIAVALVLAPVLLLPGLAWGAAGRLRPAWYPAAWLEAAQMIDHSRAQGAALLLPWAAYRRPAWNGGRAVLDPWPRLVSRQVVWNTGPQVGDVKLKPDDPAGRRVERVILAPGPLTAALETAGVRFVIVDAGGGVAHRLPGCVVLFARPGLAIYQVPDGQRHR